MTRSVELLIAADAIANGCAEPEVYTHVARFLMDQDVGMFLADAADPFQGLTRDETVTGLCLAAAYAGGNVQ